MNVLWHKVWFDLWQNKGRTILAVLSIAAGVFAVGAIFGMVDQLSSGMDAAHQAVSPSHINIILREPVTRRMAERLKDIPGVVDVDPVNQLSIRYKSQTDDRWELGTVVMRADYDEQTYDRLELKDGRWPQGDSLGVERLSSQFYSINQGSELLFEVDGREEPFTINGLIRHPFVAPPPFGGQAHFFADAQAMDRFGIPEGRFAQLLVQVDPYSLDFAQEIAGEIRSELADSGYGVVVTLYQDPDEHWGRMFVEGINLVLQIMAVVALFMSVILVFNAMTALIAQQTNQIGIIKATGGRRATIIKIYLSGVFIFGLIALIIALPLSALFAFGMSAWFLNLFNIELSGFTFSTNALILQFVAALLVPLIAGLWPVLKGASISVREAIASYGIGADFGTSRFDLAIERLGDLLLPTTYAAALGNIFRRKGRMALTLLVLIVAGTMFLVVMSLISSTLLTLDNEMARQGYDIRIGFIEAEPSSRILEVAREAGYDEGAEIWFSANATILRDGERLQDSAGLGAQLLSIPVPSTMVRPVITSGRWLQPGEGNGIVMSEETALKNKIAVGDTVTLDLGEQGDADWLVVGTYRVVYGSGFVTEPIYASLDTVLDEVNRAKVGTQLLVRTGQDSLADNNLTANQMEDLFEERGMDIDFYTTSVKLEEREYANNQFGSVTSMLLSLAMLVAAVGGIGLMGSLGISVVERTREIGVMRAVGAKSRTIMSLFIMEGVLQGLISWAIAVPLAYLLAEPLARQLGQTMIEIDLDYAFYWTAVFAWLLTILVIALLASILPARKAANISVRESLAYT